MAWNLFPTKRPTISVTTVDLLILFGLMTLFYYIPLLHPAFTSYSGDAFSLFLPGMDLYRNSMFQGIIPLWNPYLRMGTPFLASYQAAVLYPPQLIALFFDNAVMALNFGTFLSILWFTFGAYLFGARALKLARFPSLLMGVALGASGFVGAHMDHVNQLAAIAWIPWILAETVLLLRRPKIRHVILLAIFTACQVLAGHPQYVVYTLIYLAALDAIYFVYFLHRRRIDDPPAWIGMLLLAVALAAGIALAAAQVLPSAELSARSIRQIDQQLWPDRMYDYSYPPEHLLTLVAPNAFGNPVTGLHNIHGQPLLGEEAYNYGEFTAYIGILTLILALIAIVTLFREFVVRCFLVLALLSLLLAFGKHVPPLQTPPYGLLKLILPTIEHMRVPARFMVFFNISIVVLAAVGFNQIIYYLRVRQRGPLTAIAPLCFLILVVALFDLYCFSRNQSFRHRDRVDILHEAGPAIRFLANQQGEYRVFRLMFEVPYDSEQNQIMRRKNEKRTATRQQLQRLQPNLNMLHDVAICQGYEEGLQPTLDNYFFLMSQCRRNLFTPQPDTWLLGLMNVRYLMTDKPVFSDRLRLRQVCQYTQALDDDSLLFNESLPTQPWSADSGDALWRHAIYENLDYLPRFVWKESLAPYYDLASLDANPARIPSQIDPDTGQRVQVPFLAYRQTNRPPGEIAPPDEHGEKTLLIQRPKMSPNAYTVSKSERTGGTLMLLESAYPGWTCRWNEKKHPMERVNAIMMAAEVPVGPKAIQVRYEPFSFRLGLFISCCFVALMAGLAFFMDYPRDATNPLIRRRIQMRRRNRNHD